MKEPKEEKGKEADEEEKNSIKRREGKGLGEQCQREVPALGIPETHLRIRVSNT